MPKLIKKLPELSSKCSVTITSLNKYIDNPSTSNDRKAWKSFRQFIDTVEEFSSEYEIEDQYEDLIGIRKTVALLRTKQRQGERSGLDVSKVISTIQGNYCDSIEVIKEIQKCAGAVEPSTSIGELWTGFDIPLRTGFDRNLLGRWHCEWFNYNEKTKKQDHYSDDIIDVRTVDIKTGYVYGIGVSAYGPNVNFTIEGRASKRKMVYLLYSSPFPFESIFGSVMLSYRPPGVLRGWWLGTGFLNEIVGGETIWKHERCDKRDFKPKSYHGREKL